MGKQYQKGKRPEVKPSGHSLAKIVITPLLYQRKDLFLSDNLERTSSDTSRPTIHGVGFPLRTRDIFRFVSSLKHLPFNFSERRREPVPQLQFSFSVIQFKFSTLLSVLISLIWLAQGLFSGFGMNAIATSLFILHVLQWFLSEYRFTHKYPLGYFIGFKRFHLFQRQCLTLPIDDTWYLGNPSISFHSSVSI